MIEDVIVRIQHYECLIGEHTCMYEEYIDEGKLDEAAEESEIIRELGEKKSVAVRIVMERVLLN